jgi:hypothetical protein
MIKFEFFESFPELRTWVGAQEDEETHGYRHFNIAVDQPTPEEAIAEAKEKFTAHLDGRTNCWFRAFPSIREEHDFNYDRVHYYVHLRGVSWRTPAIDYTGKQVTVLINHYEKKS